MTGKMTATILTAFWGLGVLSSGRSHLILSAAGSPGNCLRLPRRSLWRFTTMCNFHLEHWPTPKIGREGSTKKLDSLSPGLGASRWYFRCCIPLCEGTGAYGDVFCDSAEKLDRDWHVGLAQVLGHV